MRCIKNVIYIPATINFDIMELCVLTIPNQMRKAILLIYAFWNEYVSL